MKTNLCPTCFAKEIDPVILRYDEADQEYYCIKCTWFGSAEAARMALQDLMRHKHRVHLHGVEHYPNTPA